ncbi:MAG: SH3 domain-containing protein [Cypionkella sp.]
MNKHQEKVLVATLCGLIITVAAGFAVQPAMAAGYGVDQLARVSGVADWDHLNVRKWPASYSQKIGAFEADTPVWVDRCIEVPNSADWCLVDRGGLKGWVNSKFLTLAGDDWDI